MQKIKPATRDFIDSFKNYRLWLFLGALEVKQRYRRSVLGPWWISISMLIFVSSMSVVFSRLFHQNIKEYIPFFMAGYLAWQLISTCISEATDLFKSNVSYIKQINLPYNLYVLKHLTRQLSVFMHNFVVFLLIAVIFQVHLGLSTLLIIPGIFLLILNLYWASLFIGLLSSRFRDMTPIINNAIQIAFFITPISWMPKLLSADSLVIKLNPLVYFIEIIRSPLLGTAPSMHAWAIASSITIIGLSLSFYMFSFVRHRIVFWLD